MIPREKVGSSLRDVVTARGGPGVGKSCTVCGLPGKSRELEFEIQAARHGNHPGLDRFHVRVHRFVLLPIPFMHRVRSRQVARARRSGQESREGARASGLPTPAG
jgi:hypothetical protein